MTGAAGAAQLASYSAAASGIALHSAFVNWTDTLTGLAIGAANAGRVVVVGIHGVAGTARTVTGVTIGGVTAVVGSTQISASGSSMVAFAAAVVPTGTTADVVVTWSGGGPATYVCAWPLIGVLSTTPTAMGSDADGTSGTTNSASVDQSAGGICLGIYGGLAGSDLGMSMSGGVTEDGENSFTGVWNAVAGSALTPSDATAVNVTGSGSGSMTRRILLLASYR